MWRIIHNRYVLVKAYNIVLKSIVFLGLFIFPFVFWPWTKIAYEIPRVWLICRWIEFLFFFGLIGFSIKGQVNSPNSKLIKLIVILFFFSFFSAIWGVDFQRSLWGNYYRGDGLITYLHLFELSLFFAFFWKDKWKNSLIMSITLSSLLTSLYSCYLGYRYFILNDFSTQNWYGEIGGNFGNPNFLAGYLLVVLPFNYYLYQIVKKPLTKLSIVILILIQLIAIGLTFSVIGIIGAIIFCCYIVFDQIKNPKVKKILFVLALLSIIILALLIKDRFFFNENNSNKGYIAQSRQRIVVKLIIASLKKPLLGWGWANVDKAFESVVYPYQMNNDVYVDKAHSNLLEILVTTGIIGLLIYISIIVVAFRLILEKIRQKKDIIWWKTIFLVFFIFFLHSQTNVLSINEEIIFWLIFGIISK